jgi:maltose O-acetyltransferase
MAMHLEDEINDAVWRLTLLRSRACLVWWGARGAQFGPDARVLGRVLLNGDPGTLIVGSRSTLNHGALLDLRDRITIGNDVHISSYSQLHTGYLELSLTPRRHGKAPIFIEDHVWIAAGAVVGAGVRIGAGAVVAAGAVVVDDVSARTLVGGVPARPIRALAVDEDPEAAGT